MRIIVTVLLALSLVSCSGGDDKTAASGVAEETQYFKWKLVTTWPKNYPGLGTAPENFAKKVDAMSNGRLQIKVFGAGQLVPAFEVFDAVSQGTAEMGHGASYYWTGKSKAAAFSPRSPLGLTLKR